MRLFALALATLFLFGCSSTPDTGLPCKYKKIDIADGIIYFDVLYDSRWLEMHVAVHHFKIEVRADGKNYATLNGDYLFGPAGGWKFATLLVPSLEDKESWERFLDKNGFKPKRVLPQE